MAFFSVLAMMFIVGERTKPSKPTKGSSNLPMKIAYVISTVASITNIIPLGTEYNS